MGDLLSLVPVLAAAYGVVLGGAALGMGGRCCAGSVGERRLGGAGTWWSLQELWGAGIGSGVGIGERVRMTLSVFVMPVMDTRTGIEHLVNADMAAMHRRWGVYPVLCGLSVAAASLTMVPARRCSRCVAEQEVRSSGTGPGS